MHKQHISPDLPTQSAMLTVNAVATMLACSPRTIYRLADTGRIPAPARIGGMVRWPRESLERWVADGCPVPTNGQDSAKTGH